MSLFQDLMFAATIENDPLAWLMLSDHLAEEGKPMILDVGEKYLVYTATHYWCGECTESTPGRTLLDNASWVVDTGRLSEAFKTGEFAEVEPLPDGNKLHLNTQAIIAAPVWPHALPRRRK